MILYTAFPLCLSEARGSEHTVVFSTGFSLLFFAPVLVEQRQIAAVGICVCACVCYELEMF